MLAAWLVSLLGLSSGQASMATAPALPSVPWLCQTLRRGAGASGAAKQRLRRSPEFLGDERRKWGGGARARGEARPEALAELEKGGEGLKGFFRTRLPQ